MNKLAVIFVIILFIAPWVNFLLKNKKIEINSSQNNQMAKLIIDDQKIGTGKEVKSGDTISIHYLGTLENGKKFDSSYDRGQPFETQIGVGMLIEGWDKGIPGMKVGGKRKLTIPPELAYGDQGAGADIPPKSTIVFEVELLEIK